WQEIEARLESAEAYWVVSVRANGMPTPRPVWGIWQGERLLLSVGSTSHWQAIRSDRGNVAVHLPDPLFAVIVEGVASQATGDDVLKPYVEVYNRKYNWNFEAANPMVADGTIEVAPSTILAWSTVPMSECTPTMTFP